MSTAEIAAMPLSERLQTMELLWDSLTMQEEELASPEWHGDVLAERREHINSGKAKFYTLTQLKERLQSLNERSHCP